MFDPDPELEPWDKKPYSSIELVNDLDTRVSKVVNMGKTGDIEVIEYLANTNKIDYWWRKDSGKIVGYTNEEIKFACKHKIEMRPL